MTLIILLMVLLLERVALQSNTWQISSYLDGYISKFKSKIKKDDALSLVIFVAAPAVIIGILLFLVDSRLIEFVLGLFVLAVCIGNQSDRKLYRQFLNAKQRGDNEAAAIIHFQLMGEKDYTKSEESIGETLIWINLKYYAGPIFYFIVFGIPGVIFYSTLLYLNESKFTGELSEDSNKSHLFTWLEWLMWVPARLVSVGYMFVGHFGQGLEAWLRYTMNLAKDSRFVITKVAMAAEGLLKLDESSEDNQSEDLESVKVASEKTSDDYLNENESINASLKLLDNAEVMVRLAKRNMVLFLVVVALLTLYGQIV